MVTTSTTTATHNNNNNRTASSPAAPPLAKSSKKHALKHTNLPSTKPQNGTTKSASSSSSISVKDDSYLGRLKSQFAVQLRSLRELFSADWNDEDLIAVLQEVEGDLETAITQIAEGFAQPWSKQEKKPKKEVKKDSAGAASSNHNASSAAAAVLPSADSSLPEQQKQRSTSTAAEGHQASARGRGRGGRGGSHARGGRTANGRDTNGNSWSKVAGSSLTADKEQPALVKENGQWESSNRDWKADWPPKASAQTGAAEVDSNWGDGSWKSDTNSHADNWSVEAAASTTSWADSAIVAAGPVIGSSSSSISSTPAPPVVKAQQPTKPAPVPSAVKPAKRGTWADIAKPAEPVVVAPVPVVVEKKIAEPKAAKQVAVAKTRRDVSPKRFAEAGTSVEVSPNRLVSAAISQQQTATATTGVLFPPGLAQVKQPSREMSPALQRNVLAASKEAAVVLPTSTAMASSNAGLTFGSLSLNKDSKPLVADKVAVNAPGKSNSSSATSPVASQFFQPQTQTVGDIGTGIYSSAADRQGAASFSQDPSSNQQQQQGMGYPAGPGMPPNMANMYAAAAAYFPIYMNHLSQFGGNPYGTAAPYPGQQQTYGANGPTSASSTGSSTGPKPASTGSYTAASNIYSNNNTTNQQQQQQSAKPAPIPAANPYNAYYGYSAAGVGASAGGYPGTTGLSAASAGGYDDYQNAYMSHYSTPQYQPQYQSQYGSLKPSGSASNSSGAPNQSTNGGASSAGGAYNNQYFSNHQYMPPHPAPSYPTFNSQAQNGAGQGQGGAPRKNSTGASGRKAAQQQQQQWGSRN